MTTPGEYVNSLVRKTYVDAPMVSGYTTARLRANSLFTAVSGYNENTTTILLENTGDTRCTIQWAQMSDRSTSGTRYDIGTAVTLVPKGLGRVSIVPWMEYLELRCTAYGPSTVRAQLESRIQWEQMAFDKIDSYYDATLWNMNPSSAP